MHTEIILKKLKEEDMFRLWEISAKEEKPEWKKWDAPYFNDYKALTFDKFVEKKQKGYINSDQIQGIFLEDLLIGLVTYYWENEQTRWLEMGITIFESNYWSKGIGTQVLQQWTDTVFKMLPQVARVGFTTWSGNERMMKLGESLGMLQEARMRKCRFYNGVYYDSIKYGILRDEWDAKMTKSKSDTQK